MPRITKSTKPLNQNQCEHCEKIFKFVNGLKLHLDKKICTKNTCNTCKNKAIGKNKVKKNKHYQN